MGGESGRSLAEARIREAIARHAATSWDWSDQPAEPAYAPGTRRPPREKGEKGIEKGMEKGVEKGMEKGKEKGWDKGMEKGKEKGMEKGKGSFMDKGKGKGKNDGICGLFRSTGNCKFGASCRFKHER